MSPRSSRIMTPVWVNGVRLNFLIDTGAYTTLVRQKESDKLGIPKFGTVQYVGFGGATSQGRTGVVSKLTVGRYKMLNAHVTVIEECRYAGILGMDILKDYLIVIDGPRGKVSLKRANA